MGKKYVIDEMTLTNIADAIREVEQDSMTKVDPVEMPERIGDVCNKAYNDGKSEGETEGYNKGHTDGYNEGHTAGKQEEYDAFWDNYQNFGNKKKYDSAFRNVDYLDYNSWTKETLRPKYDVIPTSADRTFYGVKGIADLGEHFQDLGVKLDFSKSISLFNCFCYGEWVTLPTIDCSNASGNGITGMCNYCYSLETIEKWIMSEKVTKAGQCFIECYKFKNINVEGVIAVSVSFSQSPLTVESMLSIITHLKNCSGTEDAGKYTLTLKDTCKTLMEEKGAIEELGGKTYDQYITDIGWNLA